MALKALPYLQHFNLRGLSNLTQELLMELRRLAPRVQSWDVRFAMPLPWTCLEQWLRQEAQKGDSTRTQVLHTLGAHPSPELTPREVVVAQAYALHCGRIDVCFRFTSHLNRLMTGPLERFARLFDAPSRYAIMVGCERFAVEDTAKEGAAQCFVVTFWGAPQSPGGREKSQSYIWQLSCGQMDDGCWSTDSVVPLDIDSFWDGSFLEE
ncbi:unnamed protein product [Effrenium voratum]|uniref:Uncharacterized protein n=1 Tax=Effrenium voratum TaxID=2562239 RepID=A0AA36JL51_9DINO|nr:unnamed protein product [Effrenium voratum]